MEKQIILAISVMLVAVISKAQSVPNGDFEAWSNPNGYWVPNGWETLNDMTSPMGVYTATRGGTSSDYYLKLTSQNVMGMGVMPGMAVSGMMDINNLNALSGFPFAYRPDSFTGKWQSMGNSSNDNGYIKVFLTKWNASMQMRDTVGYVSQDLNGMQMSWQNFTFPLIYNNTDVPDSCVIILSASRSNPEAGRYLYVDNLGFSDTPLRVENTEITGTFKIFPNPANHEVQIDLSGVKSSTQQFEITDLAGKVIVVKQSNGLLLQTISVGELPVGNYLFKVTTAKGILIQKISKQ